MTTPSSSSQATALTPDAAFSLERWSASSGSDRTSRASLVLVGGGRRWYAHANGNGAIDALMRAVDDALKRVLTAPVERWPATIQVQFDLKCLRREATVGCVRARADPVRV